MARFREWRDNPDQIGHFTFWIAIFTCLLFIVAALQYRAYVESESGFLIVQTIKFSTGEPASDGPLTLIITINNPGKHVAIVKEMNVSTHIGVRQKELPNEPEYQKMVEVAVMPPLAPGIVYPFIIRGDPINPANTFTAEITADLISGKDQFYVFWFIKYNKWVRFPLVFRNWILFQIRAAKRTRHWRFRDLQKTTIYLCTLERRPVGSIYATGWILCQVPEREPLRNAFVGKTAHARKNCDKIGEEWTGVMCFGFSRFC